MPKRNPLCPVCSAKMKLRNGSRGKFYGCSEFPRCRGTRPYSEAHSKKSDSPNRIEQLPGSDEQEAIWDAMLNGDTHIAVNAVAGSGKTWTMVQACLRIPETCQIGFIAFNRHIANEAQEKLEATGKSNVFARTYHSLGLAAIRAASPNVQINEHKEAAILENEFECPYTMQPSDWKKALRLARKLVGMVKNYLIDFEAEDFEQRLELLVDHHAIDVNGLWSTVFPLVAPTLRKSLECWTSEVSFDDMTWVPVVENLSAPQAYDFLIVDEAQDTNQCQQDLALKFCPSGRIVVVGDTHQAIYGFRGAGVDAMTDLIQRLAATERGCTEYPLTVTRRCPSSHVALANGLVPHLRAMDTAPGGSVEELPESRALSVMAEGDLVLCRVNAPLVSTAYALLRRRVRVVIKGKDIGKGLLTLVEKLSKNATTVREMLDELATYEYKEADKLGKLGERGEGRLMALRDKCDCLRELASNSASLTELASTISSLFDDFETLRKNAVTLGTVHRTKGLEALRVFVLEPQLIPHPLAKKEWEHRQEANLAYVAATRAKYTEDMTGGQLVFVGDIPGIYDM